MTKIPNLEEMLKAGMHFGHRTSKWHPKMAPFIFTTRNGVHIIDLVKTQKKLEEALAYLKKQASQGKVILFVGTKSQVKETMKKVAEETGMPYAVESWLGGCLTNFGVIKKSIRKYNDLLEKKQTGKLDKYTKKERLQIDREINRLTSKVGGLANLEKTPDLMFIWDPKNDDTALTEAKMKNIPVVAVCDTNVNPTQVDYVIPSNDDATKSIKMIMNLVKEAVLEGKAEIKK